MQRVLLLEKVKAFPREQVVAAYERVTSGIPWLHEKARVGWWRYLSNDHEDKPATFRAQDNIAELCVLALAFESRSDLADDEGHVTRRTVLEHYGLWGTDFAVTHGFMADSLVPGELLDLFWEFFRHKIERAHRGAYNHRATQRHHEHLHQPETLFPPPGIQREPVLELAAGE